MKTDLKEHRHFKWLLAIRAFLTLLALYIVSTSDLGQGLFRLLIIVGLLSVCESLYAAIVRASIASERRQAAEKARRERAAAEVLRQQELRKAQAESSEKYFAEI